MPRLLIGGHLQAGVCTHDLARAVDAFRHSDPIRVADTRAWLTKVLRDIAREVIDALLGRFPADVRSCRNS